MVQLNGIFAPQAAQTRAGGMFMARLLERLNEAQLEAATCVDRPVRIIAGAGSGKTSVLIARMEYLIQDCGVFPSRIMAITFTNKAAREMKERLERACPVDAGRVRVSTIHSLGARILREDALAAGYPQNFSILDADDQKALLKRIYSAFGLKRDDIDYGRMLGVISNNKMHRVSPKELLDEASSQTALAMARVYDEYVRSLKSMKAMDFDDLILETDRLLKENAKVREKWQDRLDYIHVDEFQDVDPIQYSIVRSLCRPDTALAVVGDPDQTIYTWRNASVNIILDFEKDFPDAKTIILSENYRSTSPILDAANDLIANNISRIKKDLFSKRSSAIPVLEYEGQTDESEALFVASMILALKAKCEESLPDLQWKDIAILYRANYLSRGYEKALVYANVPYKIFGGIRFYERAEVKDILAYLNLLRKPDKSDAAFLSLNIYVDRILNTPKRGIGNVTKNRLLAISEETGLNLLEVLRLDNSPAKKKGHDFVQMIDALKKDLEEDGLENIVDHILERTGYDSLLAEKENEGRAENVEELKTDIARALAQNPDLSLDEYLEDLVLFTSPKEEERDNAVTLMTAHAAKGTEFRVVFTVSLNDGIFPSMRAVMEGGGAALEEERRLLYVSMTRAKDLLFLTWNTGYSYQRSGANIPSRFIDEIEDSHYAIMRKVSSLPHESERERRKKRKERAASDYAKIEQLRQEAVKSSRTFAGRARHAKKQKPLRKGDRVIHAKFGEGTVIAAGSIAEVEFDGAGRKKIHPDYLQRK